MTSKTQLITSPPDGYEELDLGMSNFDHEIDGGLDEALRNGEGYATHSGLDFNGKVWFEGGRFYEQVWVYGSVRGVVEADTLGELMESVNNRYGWE